MTKDMKIPYGIAHFETNRKNNFLYVDKTHFIHEIEKIEKIIYLRPRRFGKSLFLDMMDCYYDIAKADAFDDLFNGLYIHENPTENRNNYYVLRFDFSAMNSTEEISLESSFKEQVLLDVESFIERYDLDITLGTKTTSTASGILETLLNKFEKLNTGKKVYIMIDEYDHFTNSLLKGNASDFLTVLQRGGFVRAFYESMKKKVGTGIVERFFMTGVMSVSLDTMSSGFNIATNLTTRKRYADMMGFTADEVKHLLTQLNLSEKDQVDIYEDLRENYNGYLFSAKGEVKVFNSTLVLYYLKYYILEDEDPEELVDSNLNQSGTTIKNIVELKNKEDNYELIAEIVSNKEVRGVLLPFIDIEKSFGRNDIITMLFNIGLLTIKGAGARTRFAMPNKVMESLYFQYLGDLERRRHDYQIDISKYGQAIDELSEDGKINVLTNFVSDFLQHLSVRDHIGFDEKYIKLVYMFILNTSNQFIIYDELPALQGFSDIVILKAPASYSEYEYLIELKHIKKSEQTDALITKKFAEAVQQIQDYTKDSRLNTRPDLKKFVVVFSGFEVVKLEEII